MDKAYYISGFYGQKDFIIILEVENTGLVILCPNLTTCHLDILNLRYIDLKKNAQVASFIRGKMRTAAGRQHLR